MGEIPTNVIPGYDLVNDRILIENTRSPVVVCLKGSDRLGDQLRPRPPGLSVSSFRLSS